MENQLGEDHENTKNAKAKFLALCDWKNLFN